MTTTAASQQSTERFDRLKREATRVVFIWRIGNAGMEDARGPRGLSPREEMPGVNAAIEDLATALEEWEA